MGRGASAFGGIHFDTDSAEIRPDSETTIAGLGKRLKQDPRLKFFVVGHTDNVGTHEFNLQLSQRRADAVVKALSLKHSIDPARLRSVGVGLLAPVAPNDTEDGRARNRRVELVQKQ